jgi:hypothetical protein
MRSELARPLIAVTVRVNVSAAMVTDRPFSNSVRRRLSSSGVQIFRCNRFILFSLNILGFGELNGSFENLSFSTHSFKSSTHSFKSRSNQLYCATKNIAPCLNRPLLPRSNTSDVEL